MAGPGIKAIVVDSIGLAIAVGDVTRADIAAEIDELVSVVIADRIVAADIHVEETARKKGRRPVAHQVGREGAGRKVTPRPAIGTDPVELVDAQIGVIIEIGLDRSEEHTSELQSQMRTSYAVFCLKKKK